MREGAPGRYTHVTTKDRGAWRRDAECAGADPEMFDVFGAGLTRKNEIAMTYCHRCPVAEQCAEEADAFADRGVIRAGVARYDSTSAARIKTRRDAT